MPRAPFQVLVLPYRILSDKQIEYALFRRSQEEYWQGIAGGGEDDEEPEQTAQREAYEEAGLSTSLPLLKLQTIASIPVVFFSEHTYWPSDTLVVPEYSFGLNATGQEIVLSNEHSSLKWCLESEAHELLKWDSNRTALWELAQRIS